jgi:hypothetical protein
MIWLHNRTFWKTSNTKVLSVTCSTLLIALGVNTIIGGSNHILDTTVNAQLVDTERLREELRAGMVKELQRGGINQNQGAQSAPTASSDRLTLSLDRGHFIPLSPLSDSPGNQVKMLLGYSVPNSTALVENKINAVMEVYAANQTLLKTSSLPEPISLAEEEVFNLLLHSMIPLCRT